MANPTGLITKGAWMQSFASLLTFKNPRTLLQSKCTWGQSSVFHLLLVLHR